MPTSSQHEQPQTSTQPEYVTAQGQPTSTIRTLKTYRPASSRRQHATQSGQKSSAPRPAASRTTKSRSVSSRHLAQRPAEAQPNTDVSQSIASHTTTTQAVLLEPPKLRCPKFPENMNPVEAHSMSFVFLECSLEKRKNVQFTHAQLVAYFVEFLIGLFSVMKTLIVFFLRIILGIFQRILSLRAALQQTPASHPATQLRQQSSVPDHVAAPSYLSSRSTESRHTALRTAASRSKASHTTTYKRRPGFPRDMNPVEAESTGYEKHSRWLDDFNAYRAREIEAIEA